MDLKSWGTQWGVQAFHSIGKVLVLHSLPPNFRLLKRDKVFVRLYPCFCYLLLSCSVSLGEGESRIFICCHLKPSSKLCLKLYDLVCMDGSRTADTVVRTHSLAQSYHLLCLFAQTSSFSQSVSCGYKKRNDGDVSALFSLLLFKSFTTHFLMFLLFFLYAVLPSNTLLL